MDQPNENILAEGLTASQAANYLGSTDVVDTMLRAFVAAAAEAATQDDAERLHTLVDEIALRFAGQDPAYTAIPGWAVRDELGLYAAKHYGIDPNASLVDILRGVFFSMIGEVIDLLKDEATLPDVDAQFRTDAIVEKAMATLTGTYEVVYPEESGAEAGAAE